MKDKVKEFCKKYSAILFFWSLGLTFVIESLSRHSLLGGVNYLLDHPMLFAYNALFIFATLHLSLLFRRREFVAILISIIWLGFGITNCVVLFFRTTPFSAVDFRLWENALRIINLYLKPWQIGLIVVGLVGIIGGAVYYFLKSNKSDQKVHYGRALVVVVALFFVVVQSRSVAIYADILPNSYGNVAKAFEDYGFAYCFSSSVIDTGITKPADYNEKNMQNLLGQWNFTGEATAEKTPNMIFVQLESVIDPAMLKGLQLSEEALPNLRRLYNNYTGGALSVPSVGAGTANTEFEVLTGVPLDYFGAGEYPYKTILRKSTVESLAYNLKNLGYGTHAIHNNDASFYSRNSVFSRLGFDTFTSEEYMAGVTSNVLGWANDDVLTRYVMEALNSTQGKDFVYTITVQSHGKYPTEYEGELPISVSGELANTEMAYYINQIHEVDKWVGDLLAAIEAKGEDTVVVFYGDHYPTLGLEDSDLTQNTLYQTQYVIWDNMGLQKETVDLETYQLGAYLFKRLGITSGYMTQFHQTQMASPDYNKNLRTLSYDMLYGDRFVSGTVNPHERTSIVYGCSPVLFTQYYFDEAAGVMVAKGQNFTPTSRVVMDKTTYTTTFVDENTLTVPLEEIDMEKFDQTKLSVSMFTAKDNKLGRRYYFSLGEELVKE